MNPEKKSFYITTTLPYVNAELHVGHAMELIRADVIARYKAFRGYEVFFNTGTDEHGLKIAEAATAAGKTPQAYTDFYADKFKESVKTFGLDQSSIHLVRTTDPHHEKAAQAFWRRCNEAGYIYKKNYKAKYCVGCELEKTDSELVDGKCPLHPTRDIEIIEEENYFFKFSAFQDKLLQLYSDNPNIVVPAFRLNEMIEFVRRGLEDFSISRLKSKMAWGIPVPDDEEHVMYVWFDALVNYISTLGWPEDETNFKKFWVEGTPMQYCGKDNTRFQAAMWQAMLIAAGLPPTNTIVVNGFITGEGGVKMSKSLGNVVSPYDIVNEYGTDALRYFVLREVNPFEDSSFTIERFKEAYNANLANGIGNLLSRIMKMATTHIESPVEVSKPKAELGPLVVAYEAFNLQHAANHVWMHINDLDKYIQDTAPFKVVKEDKEKGVILIKELVDRLYKIACMLAPMMPATADAIKECIATHSMPVTPLFVRKD